MNYILKFFKSLTSYPLGARDFLFTAIIIIMISISYFSNRTGKTSKDINIPTFSKVEKRVDNKGVTHSIVEEKQFTKSEMKEATKSIKKDLNTSEIESVTQSTTNINITTPEVPLDLDMKDNSISSSYDTKDIHIEYNGDISTKTGLFKLHLTPDTTTFIRHRKGHLFKPDEHKVDIVHSNKLFVDSMALSYSYTQPKIIIVFGPSIGANIVGINSNFTPKIKPYIGIGATFNLISIKSK